MAAIRKIAESTRLDQLKPGQLNNNFVRASEYNKLVDRVNSFGTEDGVLTLSGDVSLDDLTVADDVTVGGDVSITGALTVTGATTISGALLAKANVVDTGGAYATPVVLTEAQSGSLILVDDAAGLDFTLPAISASNVGMTFEFLVTVTITSNNFRVTAGAADLLNGGVLLVDFDAAYTAPQGAFLEPDFSDDLVMTCNGTTTGGKKGTRVKFEAVSATQWFVSGIVAGDGVLATPFS